MPRKRRKYIKRVRRTWKIGSYQIVIKDLDLNTAIFKDLDQDFKKLKKRLDEFCKEKFNV